MESEPLDPFSVWNDIPYAWVRAFLSMKGIGPIPSEKKDMVDLAKRRGVSEGEVRQYLREQRKLRGEMRRERNVRMARMVMAIQPGARVTWTVGLGRNRNAVRFGTVESIEKHRIHVAVAISLRYAYGERPGDSAWSVWPIWTTDIPLTVIHVSLARLSLYDPAVRYREGTESPKTMKRIKV